MRNLPGTHPDDPDFVDPTTTPGQPAINAAMADDAGDEVERIQQLVRELNLEGGTANVFRIPPGQSEQQFVGEMSVDDFTIDRVARAFGGGKFTVKFKAASGRYVRQVRFAVDPRIEGEMDRQQRKSDQQTAPVVTNDMHSFLMLMMRQAEDRAAKADEAARAAAERNAQMQVGMMTTLVSVMTEASRANAQLMAAAMSREPRDVTPVEPSSHLLQAMMPLMLENMKPRHGLGELVETVKVVKELSGAAPEEPEKEDMLDKVMKVGGPIIGALLTRNQPMPTPPMVPQPKANPQGSALPAPAVDDEQARVQAKVRGLVGQLRIVTPMLVKAAGRNAPIESYMDVLDDVLDDESWSYLVAFLERDDWVSTLFADDPGVIRHRPWFDNFRLTVLHEAKEETTAQGQDPDAPRQPGLVP